MDDRGEIERQLAEILDHIKKKEEKFEKLGFRVGVPVFVALVGAVIWNARGNWPASWEDWGALAVFGLGIPTAISFGVGAGVFWAACLPAEREARRRYVDTFATKDARNEADNLLLGIVENEHSLEMLRLFRRRLGVVIRQFRCSACDARLDIIEEDQSAECRKCKIQVRLPTQARCPKCGGGNTRLLNAEEQVAPIETSKGKMAGAMMYGPVGILAGGVLDAIYRPFKEAFRALRVATKGHIFRCEDCHNQWAFKLPLPGDR